MRDWYLDMFEKEGEERGIERGRLLALDDLVKSGILTLEIAAKAANFSPEEFELKIAELAAEK